MANANMERAIRVVSVQRGFDPRDFALLAFGGAGGMHACEIADVLDITTVIAPRHAGVLSALGMLLADVKKDYSQSVLRPADEFKPDELERRFAPLVERAFSDLRNEGFERERSVVERALDVRYVGQSHEITVPFDADYRAEFDRRHRRLYGYASSGRPTEVVNVRVKAIGVTAKPELPRAAVPEAVSIAPRALRPAFFSGRRVETGFYRRDELPAGATG
ncbi:MAG: hypothetical protein HYU53_18365 [Acidobacteria bacterium]|nr:hypothetical protein [Acidobacteriota bacterium]